MKIWLYVVVLFIKSLLAKKVLLPQRENLVILLDIQSGYDKYIKSITEKLLDGISLRKYRIAYYTTYGITDGILDFQSKECIVKKLRTPSPYRSALDTVLRKSAKDIVTFAKEKFQYLLITDRALTTEDRKTVEKIISRKNCQEFDIITIDPSNNIKIDSDKIKHIRAKVNEVVSRDILHKLTFYTPNLNKCNIENEVLLDQCNRECKCQNGHLVDCYRVRKEFNTLSLHERKRYLYAYRKLSTDKQFKDVYDHYCKYHHDYFEGGIHHPQQFFPWHRKYLLGYENLIRLIDCRITVPVWNWARHSYYAWSIKPHYYMWDNIGGFGGNGISANSFCVRSGMFKAQKWRAPSYEESDMIDTIACGSVKKCGGHYLKDKFCLRRRFSCNLPRENNVHYVLKNFDLSTFNNFETEVRANWHNQVHTCTGGTMATDYASDTPEFWLHHGMLDSIWDEWQSKGFHFKHVGFTNQLNLTLLGFYPKEKRAEFLDNNNLGSCGVKIRYEDIIYHNNSKLKHHLHHQDPNNYSEDQYNDPVNNELEDNHIHVFQDEYDESVNNPNKVIRINYSQGEYYEPVNNQYEDTYIHVSKVWKKEDASFKVSDDDKDDVFHNEDYVYFPIKSKFIPKEEDTRLLKEQHQSHPELSRDTDNIYHIMPQS